MDLEGYYKRLCNTCYGTSHFSAYTMRTARVESQLHAYSTEEMRENFSKYYYPRTRLRKEIHLFLNVTSMPLFPMLCGTLLDIQSALALTQSCVNCAAHKQYLFYDADVHTPVRGQSREGTDAWEAYLRYDRPIVQRVAVGFLDHGPFCNPQASLPSMNPHIGEIKNDRLMAFSPRPVLLHEKSHPLWGFRGEEISANRTSISP